MPPPDMSRCTTPPLGRRRIWWATHPDACGLTAPCPGEGERCGRPGLAFERVYDEGGNEAARTISNRNWIEGLVLNTLLTDKSLDDTTCGHIPGTRSGWNWSEAFRRDGGRNGSALRNIPCGPVGTTIAMAEAAVSEELAYLVAYGVARSVGVSVAYVGRNEFAMTITLVGEGGDTIRVGVKGTRLANGYLWETQRPNPNDPVTPSLETPDGVHSRSTRSADAVR